MHLSEEDIGKALSKPALDTAHLLLSLNSFACSDANWGAPVSWATEENQEIEREAAESAPATSPDLTVTRDAAVRWQSPGQQGSHILSFPGSSEQELQGKGTNYIEPLLSFSPVRSNSSISWSPWEQQRFWVEKEVHLSWMLLSLASPGSSGWVSDLHSSPFYPALWISGQTSLPPQIPHFSSSRSGCVIQSISERKQCWITAHLAFRTWRGLFPSVTKCSILFSRLCFFTRIF